MEKIRIMIANRGEIAARIAKAIKELGYTAVGLFTDNELHASHLAYCHEWIRLPGKIHAETYLDIPKIVGLAKKHKIDAVHPGYGFLAENGNFAEELQKAGIIFIGPHPEAIRSMGDKAVSKTIAKEADVPVVPGSSKAIPTVKEALEIAQEIGYPVLLKAVAGGGGRGMRVCNNEEEVKNNFEAVGREAKSAFGNGDLLVEKFIVNPLHGADFAKLFSTHPPVHERVARLERLAR